MHEGEELNTQGYLADLNKLLLQTYNDTFEEVVEVMHYAYDENKKVFIAGNGGNSANAEHLVTDLTKGLFLANGKALNIQNLSSNIARFSAATNDLDKEMVFTFLLDMLHIDKDSIVILLSAGGKSQNIAAAAKFAHERGAKTLGLIGGVNSPLEEQFDLVLRTISDDIQLVEDVHAVFGHLVYKKLINS